jgi:fatty-acyl-CoA synthase
MPARRRDDGGSDLSTVTGDFAFSPLTPGSFLDRSAAVFPDRLAVVDGDLRFTYSDYHRRSSALTGALASLGIGPGDKVAALCTNSHVMLELHHGVPWRGAVLVPLNTRLSAAELSHVVEHSGARALVATHELQTIAQEVAVNAGIRLVIAGGPDDEYEQLVADAEPARVPCLDERGLLAINYTSGTTGTPKGVMYHHRGAYLQALAMTIHTRLTSDTRYLWTLPMFHCHGWCFTWAVGAAGGTHVCMRGIDPTEIWRLLRDEGITHLSGAPTVLTMIAAAPAAAGRALTHDVLVTTGGAPPSPTLLETLAQQRFDVTHLYGLTETFGPLAINDWHPEWDSRPEADKAVLRARQGVGNTIADRVRVVQPDGTDVAADGATTGEIVARGNNVMLGYYRDAAATAAASLDGWLRTGDVGVMHPDGYVEIKDRLKDVIISGGENISSVEVERVIDSHPAVLESALIGRPDSRWGEVPVAYVTLRVGATVTDAEIIEYVRQRIAHFKAPRDVVFAELPKTATGKIRKSELRLGSLDQPSDESVAVTESG